MNRPLDTYVKRPPTSYHGARRPDWKRHTMITNNVFVVVLHLIVVILCVFLRPLLAFDFLTSNVTSDGGLIHLPGGANQLPGGGPCHCWPPLEPCTCFQYSLTVGLIMLFFLDKRKNSKWKEISTNWSKLRPRLKDKTVDCIILPLLSICTFWLQL